MSGKGPKGRSHRDPGGSAQDVMGESETARTPAMGSGVGATAAMVEAVDRDRVDGDIGPGDTFQAPPQQSRPTPGKGDNWRQLANGAPDPRRLSDLCNCGIAWSRPSPVSCMATEPSS